MQKTAEELAKKQREISIAEFFEKNRHLLGFDNPRKSLLTGVKEAVDNSLDACEEARILPEINVEIIQLSETRFRVIVEDNGPGIVKKQIPNIFARLLYGSKFHKLAQSLTGDQPLLLENKGKVEITTLGAFVDQFLAEEAEQDISALNIRVPAFDLKTYHYNFMPVSHVIKHQQRNEIYEITLETGRKIKVTGCHSIFSVDNNAQVREVETRKVKCGDHLIVPKRLPSPSSTRSICLLEYVDAPVAQKQWWYIYGLDREYIERLFRRAVVIHKKTSKSRKFYRFIVNGKNIDVLDDSYKQYRSKGFLPVHLALKLGITPPEQAYIQTYQHGRITKIPVYWTITPQLMRFLGFYVAEGHCDHRQIGYTFGSHEKEFVQEMIQFAVMHGVNNTVENRPEKNCIRLKLFGGLLSYLMEHWCGKGAKNKKIPSFVFNADAEHRQHFLDALYQGDGHCEQYQLMHTTVSERLANELQYLWLFQGVVASQEKKVLQGLGKFPSTAYVTSIYGDDINQSYVFSCATTSVKKYQFVPKECLQGFNPKNALHQRKQIFRSIGLANAERQYNSYERFFHNAKQTILKAELTNELHGHQLYHLENMGLIESGSDAIVLTQKFKELEKKINVIEKFVNSDLCLVRVKSIEKLPLENQWVYDISVPGCENFVAGIGGIAAHNSRGQQGIGISATVLYGQLTTGKPATIISKTGTGKPAIKMKLKINTQTNLPEIVEEQETQWDKDHGTKIEVDLDGSYIKGRQSVDEYVKQTAIINPYATFIYTNPEAQQVIYSRATNQLPPEAKEIQPHPYGVELGRLMKMLEMTQTKTLQQFLTGEFSRVGPGTAKEICQNASLLTNTKPTEMTREMVEQLYNGIQKTKIMAPPTDCLSPIGQELLEKSLKKEINAEFYCAISRPVFVYRGNPFQVEVAIAYGGNQPKEEQVSMLRYANKVPLLYQQGSCAFTKAVLSTSWKPYGLEQSNGALPVGPATLLLHIASVWVPFTSESKEALAHYPEIIKEIKLALQEAGRRMQIYVNKKVRVQSQLERANLFERYIPEIADALSRLTGENKEKLIAKLNEMIKKAEIQQEIMQMVQLKGDVEEGTQLAEKTSEED
ncbi:DNA topoisomerase VI subunit B [Candidatus Woesearchaeota archaeon]|nr:DNA topoisomerase VI subunit B [Candidatus Woesearchaeota archaeon]